YENLQGGGGYNSSGQTVAFTPDSKFLIASGADRSLQMWHADTGKMARRIDIGQNYIHNMVMSPNGRFLAASCSDGRVRIIAVASGAELRTFNPAGSGMSRYAGYAYGGMANVISYSPDGRYLASIVNNQSVRVWEVSSGKELHDDAGHRGAVVAAAFLADGRVVTAGQDQMLRCWDPKTGKELDRLSQ